MGIFLLPAVVLLPEVWEVMNAIGVGIGGKGPPMLLAMENWRKKEGRLSMGGLQKKKVIIFRLSPDILDIRILLVECGVDV